MPNTVLCDLYASFDTFQVWILFHSLNARSIPYFIGYLTLPWVNLLKHSLPPTQPCALCDARKLRLLHGHHHMERLTQPWTLWPRTSGVQDLLVSRDTGSFFKSDLISDLHLDPHFLQPSVVYFSKTQVTSMFKHPPNTFLISSFSMTLKHQTVRAWR